MTAPAIRIRRASAQHHAALLDLQLTILPEDEPLVPDKSTVWWLAWDQDEPVAFACITKSKQMPDGGYLSRAGVLKAYRGQGLQKRLIRVRVDHARRQGWAAVVTDTRRYNSPSINSLVACGFRSFNPTLTWSVDACYWRRLLTPKEHS